MSNTLKLGRALSNGSGSNLRSQGTANSLTAATFNLGCRYRDGEYGLPQDLEKAAKLWLKVDSGTPMHIAALLMLII